jgi:excisionase family DNA binding protein
LELLTIQDTAQLLKVSTITVRRFIADGRLPAVKVGRGVRVHKEAVEQLAAPTAVKTSSAYRAHAVGTRGKRFTKDDALWHIVGIAGAGGDPTDIARHELEYLADAYTDPHR